MAHDDFQAVDIIGKIIDVKLSKYIDEINKNIEIKINEQIHTLTHENIKALSEEFKSIIDESIATHVKNHFNVLLGLLANKYQIQKPEVEEPIECRNS